MAVWMAMLVRMAVVVRVAVVRMIVVRVSVSMSHLFGRYVGRGGNATALLCNDIAEAPVLQAWL
jgi:hypothetical protein